MEAIVLAGGFGTRLQSVVSEVPKPMAPINEVPFLEYILKYLQNNNVKKVILSVGYKWEIIKEYFGDKFQNIELVYSVEDEPLGTGGAIKKAMQFVQNQEVYIINGDTFFKINLKSLKLQNNSKLQLSLKKMYDFDRYGCVEIQEDFVIKFTEKSYQKEGNINGGIYLASKNLFDSFELEEKFSFEEFMEENINILKITAKIFEDYFIDIGIPDDYRKAQSEIKEYI